MLLGQPHLLLPERRPVGAGGVVLVRAALRDVRPDDDQRGLVRDGDRVLERLLEVVEPDVLLEVLHVPAVRLVALADVLGERQLGVALDRDVVLVVERDQPAEAEVAGQRGRLAGDPLLEVAVGGDRERPVIDYLMAGAVEAGREHPLGQRHPHRVGDPLSERAGGDLDPGQVAVLGMTRGHRAELAEPLEVVLEADVVAGQVQGRIQQHRRVPAREHEPIAVRPVRLMRAVAHDPRVQDVRDRRQGHRGSRVP